MTPEQIMTAAMLDELEKIALVHVHHIEDQLGFPLNDKQERKVREMIREKKSKSFILRHPILTGIPTLGIAPLAARGMAADDIRRKLVRRDPKIRGQYAFHQGRKKREEAESYERSTSRMRATQPERAVRAAALPLMMMSGSREKDKK